MTVQAATSCAPIRVRWGYDDSTAFCAALPEQVGVAAIPDDGIL